MIIALIELALGVTEKDVKRDFIASNMDLRKNQLDLFLSKISELGGIEKTLKILGVKDHDIAEVQEWLRKKR